MRNRSPFQGKNHQFRSGYQLHMQNTFVRPLARVFSLCITNAQSLTFSRKKSPVQILLSAPHAKHLRETTREGVFLMITAVQSLTFSRKKSPVRILIISSISETPSSINDEGVFYMYRQIPSPAPSLTPACPSDIMNTRTHRALFLTFHRTTMPRRSTPRHSSERTVSPCISS